MLVSLRSRRIGVIGLGDVGLPLAVESGQRFDSVGFDVIANRIRALYAGRVASLKATRRELRAATRLGFTANPSGLKRCRVFTVTVPSPIDEHKRLDLGPLRRASETVGRMCKRGDVVVYESTVYPGYTEEICVPILEQGSGLRFNKDFFSRYSPERINLGDQHHRLANIRKVTADSDGRR
ncbi:MAG TPA: hypothetical protein VF848_06365 [Steroidobacteraceae bacterium]